MNFLRNLKIRNKLALVLLAPLLGLSAFSFLDLYQRYQYELELKALEKLSQLALQIGDLVHETQREGSLSAIYTASGGTLLRNELAQQRLITSRKQESVRSYLSAFSTNRNQKEFDVAINASMEKLDKIAQHRDEVDLFKLSPEEAVHYYSSVNHLFFLALEHMKDFSPNAEVSQFLSAYFNFVAAKDKEAVLNGLISMVLIKKQITPSDAKLLYIAQAKASVYFDVFTASIPVEQKNLHKNTLQGRAIDEVERIKQLVLSGNTQRVIAETPTYWFSVSSERLNLLKDFEEKMAGQLIEVTKRLNVKAERAVIFGILIGSAVMVFSVLVALILARLILRPVDELQSATELIVEGDIDARVDNDTHDEIGDLARAFNHMVDKLHQVSSDNEKVQWLKAGQAELSDQMRGEQDLAELSRNVVTYLAKYIGAQVGVFYAADKEGRYNLQGSYAYTRRKSISNKIEPGEGVVGQAALEKEIIVVSDLPDDYISMGSGVGTASLRNLVVVPAIYAGSVKAIIELGAVKPFDDMQLELLSLVSENVAIAVNSVQEREEMEHLLDYSQAQAEQLQRQQSELRAANEKLEEKTAAILKQKDELEEQNAAIEFAKKELEKKAEELYLSGKYKSEFLANMSHELRTPLNSLLILARSLADNEDGNLAEDEVEAAEVIHSGGLDLLNLINDILDLSKVEAGKMSIVIEEVSLQSVLVNLQSQFKPLAAQKGIDFKFKAKKNVPAIINTDKQRLEQILKNLLSNALKFTSEGSVTLRIFLPDADPGFSSGHLESGKVLGFSVIDTGIGIPQEKQAAIFEAFQQADGSTSRKFGGTGLGLSISSQLAGLLGGEVQLKSEEGVGSTFSLYLPLDSKCTAVSGEIIQPKAGQAALNIDAALPELSMGEDYYPKPEAALLDPPVQELQDSYSEPVKERTGAASSGAGRKILLVDDDKRNIYALKQVLKQKGLQIITAENGQEAIDALQEDGSVELVIMDVMMPVMDGYEAMRRIRSDGRYENIPIIALTAKAMQGDRTTCLEAGASDYMMKPINADNLITMINTWLD